MAARENQGIQIALIIFVILTVALGVSTYLFFDKFQQETLKIAGFKEEAEKARDAQAASEQDLRRVKLLLTNNPGDKVDDLAAAHEEMIKSLYPVDRNEKTPTYPQLIEYIKPTLNQLAGDLDSARRQVIAQEKKIQSIELAQKGQIGVFEKKLDTTKVRQTDIDDKYKVATEQFVAKTDAALADVERQKQALVKTEAGFQQKIVAKDEVIREKEKRTVELENAIKEYRPAIDEVKVAQGEITLVSTGEKTAYINLGSQDGVRPRVRFLIFPNDNTAIDEAAAKAVLEVTQVLEGHRSIGRILEGKLLDPVLAKDRIWSDTWQKGQRTGFALAGWMDMDGDGRSDRVKIAAIIAQNGGRIDAQVHDDGRIEGEMALTTDYLIQGEFPREPKGNKAAQRGYEQFEKTAKANNSKTLDFRKYLQTLGYSIVDSQGNTTDFRSRKPGDKKDAYQ
jgi:hypothetical protein